MANDDNLHPIRTEEEARAKGRNGGIKSGESRRRKRDMKNAARLLLDMATNEDSMKRGLTAMGFDEEDQTNQMVLLVSMFKEAVRGNVSAAAFLRDTACRNPARRESAEYRKAQLELRQQEFEYRRQKEAGIEYEIEDLDEIEGIIYGDDNVCEATGKPEGTETTEDNTV